MASSPSIRGLMFGRRNPVKVSPRCGSTGMIQWIRSCTVGGPMKATWPTTPNRRGRHPIRSTCSSSRASWIAVRRSSSLHFLKKAEWQNSRIMKGDLSRIVARLKREPGKDMIVDAGPSLVQEFIQRGLADDYRIIVMPVIFGRGKNHYWGSMLKQQILKLLSVKSLKHGELMLHYETVR